MKLRNLEDIARHLGASDGTVRGIGRRLFKDTESGISFGAFLSAWSPYVWVQGYAEGSDAELPDYCMTFPIDSDYFDHTVDEADHDGVCAWEDANG